eukprot:UN29017
MKEASDWVLEFSEVAQELSPYPLVFSLSYGWSELGQCDIAYMKCLTLGYDSATYVNKTNINFQKMATMGATIMVSDGDDGAQGVQPPGWDPIDLDHWCPGEYVCYPRESSECANFGLHNTTTGDVCPWPVGHMNDDSCGWLYLGDFYQDSDIEKALKEGSPDCTIETFIDGSYSSHLYSSCPCNKLGLKHEDVEFVELEFSTTHRIFYPDFPTSSPYVTSVGATQFKQSNGVISEVAASVKTGAIITTGGGFSVMSSRPDWQSEAVQGWVSLGQKKPPAGTYSTDMRGYPDISFNGHNYQVWYTDDGG